MHWFVFNSTKNINLNYRSTKAKESEFYGIFETLRRNKTLKSLKLNANMVRNIFLWFSECLHFFQDIEDSVLEFESVKEFLLENTTLNSLIIDVCHLLSFVLVFS